jgi:hypothetical protein
MVTVSIPVQAATLPLSEPGVQRLSRPGRGVKNPNPAFCAKKASIHPFRATLASPQQRIENPSTLSLAFVSLTRLVSPNPFVCNAYRKQGGVILFFWLFSDPANFVTSCLWPTHERPATPFLSYAYFTLLCIPQSTRPVPLRSRASATDPQHRSVTLSEAPFRECPQESGGVTRVKTLGR